MSGALQVWERRRRVPRPESGCGWRKVMSGFLGRLMNQWIEVIEWLDPTNDTMVYRFPVANNEIKMGARLTVREGQAAVFINEGQIADVFGPGLYTLSTQNMPILTMLKSWRRG